MGSPVERGKKTDIHIHVIGSVDEGCYISESMLKRPWSRLISHWLGLDARSPEKYTEWLVRYIREAPIDVGVILAFDAIYDDRGKIDPRTSFYIPNDYVFKVAAKNNAIPTGASIHPIAHYASYPA